MDAFCCVNFASGEVFGIFILAKFGIIFLGRLFLLKYMFDTAVFYSRVSFYDGVTFLIGCKSNRGRNEYYLNSLNWDRFMGQTN